MTQTLELEPVHRETRALCSECEQYLEPDDLSPLYECDSCGDVFTRNNSWYDSHRCSCNKFATKSAALGCDNCNTEAELVEAWISGDGAAFPDEAQALAHQAQLVQRALEPVATPVIPARTVQKVVQARRALMEAVQVMHR